jgi:hypothetical protein
MAFLANIGENVVDKSILIATNQTVVSKPLYNIISIMPVYGPIMIASGTMWNMFSNENKNLIKNKIQSSNLKVYYTKLLIIENIIKNAPNTIPISESFRTILNILEINPNLKMNEIIVEANKNVPILLTWIERNENMITDAINVIFNTIKNNIKNNTIKKGGNKKLKRKTKSKKSKKNGKSKVH